MKTASSVETKPPAKSGIWILGCAFASVLAIVVAYYFAFSAAHAAGIKDVPLATKGGRP